MIPKSFRLAACAVLLATPAFAQARAPQAEQQQPTTDQTARFGNPTVPREMTQPQGPTGPIDTTSGGVTPNSPQGDAPPGMQPFRHEPTGQGQSSETKEPPLR